MSTPAGDGAATDNSNPGGTTPPENPNNDSNETPNDGGSDNAKLVQENRRYRERAQTAEKALAEKETAYSELQSNFDKLQEEFGQTSEKIKSFEFAETKRTAVKEFISTIPEGHAISDLDLLETHVSKLANPETLKSDIEEFGKKLIVEGPQGTKLTFGKNAAPQTGDVPIDFNNPAQMAKLYEQNPQAFKESVAKATPIASQGFNVSPMAGLPTKP